MFFTSSHNPFQRVLKWSNRGRNTSNGLTMKPSVDASVDVISGTRMGFEKARLSERCIDLTCDPICHSCWSPLSVPLATNLNRIIIHLDKFLKLNDDFVTSSFAQLRGYLCPETQSLSPNCCRICFKNVYSFLFHFPFIFCFKYTQIKWNKSWIGQFQFVEQQWFPKFCWFF